MENTPTFENEKRVALGKRLGRYHSGLPGHHFVPVFSYPQFYCIEDAVANRPYISADRMASNYLVG